MEPELTAIGIEPTNRCNLRCKICYSHSSQRPKGYMDLKLFRRIIREIDEIPTVKAVGMYLGGEPLIHPRFNKMLQELPKAQDRTWNVVVSTNGMLLDRPMMKEIINGQVSRLHFSLDGIGKKHEEKRVGSNYETVKSKILEMTELKGGRTRPPGISVNMVIDNQPREEIDEFVNEWINIANVVILDAVTNDRFQYINLENLPENMRNIEEQEFCYYAFNYMGIMWNGDTLPCCCDLEGRNVQGNIINSTIEQEFMNKDITRLREMILTKKLPRNHICRYCDIGKRFIHRYLYNPAGFENNEKETCINM